MAALEVAVLAVVPIVARGVFLGALTVAVTDRPERLRPAGELLERLTGVAALAAPGDPETGDWSTNCVTGRATMDSQAC